MYDFYMEVNSIHTAQEFSCVIRKIDQY